MIRQYLICGLRIVLVTGLAQASLAACASDNHNPFPKIELSRLKQPDWWPWKDQKKAGRNKDAAPGRQDMSSAPPAPVPVIAALPAPAAGISRAAPRPAPAPSAGTTVKLRAPSLQSWNTPRPRPAPSTARIALPIAGPVVGKAPQGKVEQQKLPEILTAPPGAAPKSGAAAGYSVEDLVGQNSRTVERLLGKPDLSRQEPSAEFWQYTHADCVLFLFLYPSGNGGSEVSHAEISARDGGKDPDPHQCISALAARNAAAPG